MDARYETRVSLANGGYAVADTYYGYQFADGRDELQVQAYAANGAPVGPLTVTEYSQPMGGFWQPVLVATSDGGFLLADQAAQKFEQELYLQRYDAGGNQVFATSFVTSHVDSNGNVPGTSNATIAPLSDGGFVAAYEVHQNGATTDEVYTRTYTASNQPVGPVVDAGTAGYSGATLAIKAWPDGSYSLIVTSDTGQHLQGTSGADTLYGSQANDVLTGGPGPDVFAFTTEPWSPDHISDFTVGTDKLDLSALLKGAGYTGSDPVGDGYVKLLSDGNGGTEVFFDPDGRNPAHQWPDNIIDIEHVPVGSASWAQLSGTTPPPPPPGAPTISEAIDDVGPRQGPVMNGGATDDPQPVMRVTLPSDAQSGDTAEVRVDSGPTWGTTVTATNVANGYIDIQVGTLGNGYHEFTAILFHGGTQTLSPVFTLYEQPDATSPSPPPPPPPASGGEVLVGQDGGSNMSGGAGDDTLIAGTSGPDTMTGGGGGDHFEFDKVPWQAATVTDFTHGADKIDVSHLLASVGYSGSDPIGDGYIKFGDDGSGNTWVYFDRDGSAGTADQWGTKVATLSHVSASSITASDWIFQSGTSSPPPPPPPPPPSSGMVLTGQDGGSNLTGGSGDDTLIGGTGQDTMTGGGGADHFTWHDLPWAYAQVTDFTEGTDKIDVSALLAKYGYSGSNPIADGYIRFGDDGQGNTWIYFDKDGSAGTADQWGTHIATLEHVQASTLTSSDFLF